MENRAKQHIGKENRKKHISEGPMGFRNFSLKRQASYELQEYVFLLSELNGKERGEGTPVRNAELLCERGAVLSADVHTIHCLAFFQHLTLSFTLFARSPPLHIELHDISYLHRRMTLPIKCYIMKM